MCRVVYECEKENIDFCQKQTLIPDIYGFENSVDPDQLASMKPADQDPHCLPVCLILYTPSTIFQLKRDGSSWVEPVLS